MLSKQEMDTILVDKRYVLKYQVLVEVKEGMTMVHQQVINILFNNFIINYK